MLQVIFLLSLSAMAMGQTSTAMLNTPKIDLMYVLDGSGSVGHHNFEIVKTWVKTLSSKLDSEATKIGIVQYSHYMHRYAIYTQPYLTTEIPLDYHQDRQVYEASVDKIILQGYTTYTAHAINKTIYDFKSSDRFNDPSTLKVMILLTDGRASDVDYLKDSADYARSLGIVTYAIGVGQGTLATELKNIATGDLSSNDRVFLVSSFSSLDSIATSLFQEIVDVAKRMTTPTTTTQFEDTTKAQETTPASTMSAQGKVTDDPDVCPESCKFGLDLVKSMLKSQIAAVADINTELTEKVRRLEKLVAELQEQHQQ